MTKEELEIQQTLGNFQKNTKIFYCKRCKDDTPHSPPWKETNRGVVYIRLRRCAICDSLNEFEEENPGHPWNQ